MKLEAVFTVKNNKLYFIADDREADVKNLKKIAVSWKEVELDDEVYNEEFLAKLRDQLKSLEEKNEYAFLLPSVDKAFEKAEQKEAFINAMNHTARRVKDCRSLAGFQLPAEILKKGLKDGSDAANFIEVLAKKHEHYVYFAAESDVTAFNLAEEAAKSDIILY